MLSTILSGIVLGAIYTLAAIGLSLQWGVLKNLNFSHGACITTGAYIMWAALGMDMQYFAAFALMTFIMFFIGIGIEWVAIRPFFAKAGVEVNIFIGTVVLSSIIAQVLFLVFGGKDKDLTPAVSGIANFSFFSTTNHKLFILILAPILLLLLWLVLYKTFLGRAIQAVSQDPLGALLIGINTYRVYAITVGVATALAGISGVLLGPIYFLYPHMGDGPMTKAFIIVVLGGMGNLKGTIVAAFIIAMVEVMFGLMFGVNYAPLVVFGIMILILIFRPEGLFGMSMRRG